MPRVFYDTTGEIFDKQRQIEIIDRLNIIDDLYDEVEPHKLIKEIERLKIKKERIQEVINEDLERIILKIESLENYLKNKNI
jgi:hypothetical protein